MSHLTPSPSLNSIYRQFQHHLQPATPSDKQTCVGLSARDFDGVMQVDCFDNGLLLSRFCGFGEGKYHSVSEHFNHRLALFFIQNGANTSINRYGQTHAKAGEVWLVQGEIENTKEIKHTEHGHIKSVHLDFCDERLESWQSDGILPQAWQTKAPSKLRTTKLKSHTPPAMAWLIARLLNCPYEPQNKPSLSNLTRLELESLSLSLAHQVLSLELTVAPTPKSRIDDVIDIIYQEYACELTISGLARRVGMNDCYLKRDFKLATGKTIGEYIRTIRLNQAHQLIIQGTSLPLAMTAVGYNHLGHFKKLYQRQFGALMTQNSDIL